MFSKLRKTQRVLIEHVEVQSENNVATTNLMTKKTECTRYYELATGLQRLQLETENKHVLLSFIISKFVKPIL